MGDNLLDELARLAERLAGDAARLLLEAMPRELSDVTTKSSATDMVSEIDRASEELIVSGLRVARPDDAILAEEGSSRDGTSGVRWVIDPLDGTTNYLYGHPGFAVSIAAELDGEVVVGVVNDPMHRDVFAAVRGAGARRNGDTICVSDRSELAPALVGTGFSYDPDRRRRQAEAVSRIIGEVRDIRRMGAASVDLCSVACGRLDAYFERGLEPWDVAAGVLVASEAGARVTNLDGGPPSSEFVMAVTPGIYDRLQRLLAAVGA